MKEKLLNKTLGDAIINLVIKHRTLTQKKIRELGLYPGQDLILRSLLSNGVSSQKKLVELTNVDHSTITTSVSRLEKSGYVIKKKSSTDKRITTVDLTNKGIEVARKAEEAWYEVEKISIEGISEEEQKEFMKLIKKITQNYEKNI